MYSPVVESSSFDLGLVNSSVQGENEANLVVESAWVTILCSAFGAVPFLLKYLYLTLN